MQELVFKKKEHAFRAKFSLGFALIRFGFDRKSSLVKSLWSVAFIASAFIHFYHPLLQVLKPVIRPHLGYKEGLWVIVQYRAWPERRGSRPL